MYDLYENKLEVISHFMQICVYGAGCGFFPKPSKCDIPLVP